MKTKNKKKLENSLCFGCCNFDCSHTKKELLQCKRKACTTKVSIIIDDIIQDFNIKEIK